VILVHEKKNVLYATLTPHLGVERRSKKINGHHIVRQNLMENPKKITVLHLEDFYFGPNTALKKTTLKYRQSYHNRAGWRRRYQ
jgi:hypothetical protein